MFEYFQLNLIESKKQFFFSNVMKFGKIGLKFKVERIWTNLSKI